MTTAMDYLGTGDAAIAEDVNASGIACGKSKTGADIYYHACIWDTSDGSVTALAELAGVTQGSEARGIADDGTIVGTCSVLDVINTEHAVKWTDPSTIIDLGSLHTGSGNLSNGRDVSNGSGDAVGTSNKLPSSGLSADHWPVIWTPTIAELDDSGTQGLALGINAGGDVCGRVGSDPVWWPGAGSVTVLGFPAGSVAQAEDINDTGDICGWDDSTEPLLWPGGGAATVLPLLTGGTYAIALGINSGGDVVGSGDATGVSSSGILWSGGVAQALDLLAGGDVAEAFAVNDSQVMVGYSDDGSQTYAVVFTVTSIDGAALSDGYWG